MKKLSLDPFIAGPWRGAVASDFRSPAFLARLESISEWTAGPDAVVLSAGRNRLVKVAAVGPDRPLDLAVKQFGPQSGIKDWIDGFRGSKARRSWLASCALRERDIGTPTSVGYLERWHDARLEASCFLTLYEPGPTSFKDALIRLFDEAPVCEKFIALLQAVADAIRAMHDSGFMHRDLGNQNILLRRTDTPTAADILFIDLNRARWQNNPLSLDQRARDVSRIWLPSDLLRVFLDMLMGDQPDAALLKRERFHRKAYALIADTRHLRHPLRTRRNRSRSPAPAVYPSEKDMWIWDDKSGQAVSALRRKDRKRYFTLGRHAAIAWPALLGARGVWREYRALKAACWQASVAMKDRVGMAVEPRPETWERERALLQNLGTLPVMIRFYCHETPAAWTFAAEAARQLHRDGHAVSFALVQDRRAVKDATVWRHFVEQTLKPVADIADRIEIGHAINRVKWGLWDIGDYRRLLNGFVAAAAPWPHLKLTGPAVIDFDLPHVMAALRAVPEPMRFDALSHHLYVDRRGAPENRQGPFSAIEKFALTRAIARQAKRCDDRLIVSEVNWPLRGTGVWSPVGSPYESPWPRANDPSVDEDEYAEFMLRYLVLALCSGMVERVYWWRLIARGFGLVDDTNPDRWRERPAYRMLETFLGLLGDAVFLREESRPVEAEPARATDAARRQNPPIVHALTFRKPDGRTVDMLYATAASVEWPLPDHADCLLDAFGKEQDPVHVESAPSTLRLTGQPVYVLGPK